MIDLQSHASGISSEPGETFRAADRTSEARQGGGGRPVVEVTSFGHFEITSASREIALPPGKLTALLVYLASQTTPQPRETLISLFWGTHFDTQSRQNLRKALSRLRGVLGDDVLVGEDQVGLRPGAVWLDATRFEQLLARGTSEDRRAAVQLYGGEFLRDLTVEQSAWTDWLRTRRRRLEGLAVDAFVGLAREELAAGRCDWALEYASRALAIDGLREDAQRLQMGALAGTGRRSEALRSFAAFGQVLRRELGVEPDRATRKLADELRRVEPPRELPAAEAPPPSWRPQRERPSLAILPFENLTGDPGQDYLADGLADDLIAALSRLRWLFVISRNSSFTYGKTGTDPRSVGRELGVRYVIEGRIRMLGGRIRASVQLVDAETGVSSLALRFEHDRGDIFALQDEMTRAIAAAIEPGIRSVEIERATRRSTGSPDAYDLFLRAQHAIYRLGQADYERAVELLLQAIAIDPDYADALASLADCRVRQWSNGWLPTGQAEEVSAEGLSVARRAVAADPASGHALAVMAYALVLFAGRFPEALELVERALRLQPFSDYVLTLCAQVLVNCGEGERAIGIFEEARRFNPADPRAHATLNGIAMAHFHAGRFAEAESWSRRALAERPSWNVARRYHAASLAHLGRLDEARAEIVELLRLQPNSTLARSRLSRFGKPHMYDQYIGGLALAGLPET